jgi:hypothetical protein
MPKGKTRLERKAKRSEMKKQRIVMLALVWCDMHVMMDEMTVV